MKNIGHALRSRALLVIATVIFVACHGGGDDEDSNNTNGTVTTTIGKATITKTFKSNVTVFANTAGITEVNPGIFRIANAPDGFGINSVFTWMDRPYVVKSVEAAGGGTMIVATRDAEINEVLSQLVVNGDVTIDDADLSRIAVADESGTNVIPQVLNREGTVIHRTVKVGPCTATENDDTQSGLTTIACTLFNKSVQSGLFVINGSIGIKEIKFSGVGINLAHGVGTASDIQATPYAEMSGQVSTSDAKPAKIEGDLPFARIRLPIQATLGYVSLGVPVFLSYAVPLYNVGVGVRGEFPYANGAFSFVGTLQTPTASISSSSVFTSQINDAFLGIKSGVELALTRYPTPLATLLSGAVGWPLKDDRILSTGVFGTLGTYGSMSVQLTPPSTVACFKFAFGPRVDALVETSLLGDPIGALSSSPLTIYPNSGISGRSGCVPTITITSATCSFYGTSTSGLRYYIVNLAGAAEGPVGATVQALSNPVNGITPETPLGTSCASWSPHPVVGYGYSICGRTEGQPEATAWSSFNVITSSLAAEGVFGSATLYGNPGILASAKTSTTIPCSN